jgi:hypothetical protein
MSFIIRSLGWASQQCLDYSSGMAILRSSRLRSRDVPQWHGFTLVRYLSWPFPITCARRPQPSPRYQCFLIYDSCNERDHTLTGGFVGSAIGHEDGDGQSSAIGQRHQSDIVRSGRDASMRPDKTPVVDRSLYACERGG